MVALLLAASWAVVYLAGGSRTVAPHVFYVAVLYAAWRRSVLLTVVTALAAGALSGPVMPLEVAGDVAQPLVNWLPRLGAFVAIGVLVALMLQRVDRASAMERELARQRETMLRIVDHELRTPTTVIRGSVELLTRLAVYPDTREAEPLLAAIRRAAVRLEGLATVVAAAVTDDPRDTEEQTYVLATDVVRDALQGLPQRHDRDRSRVRIDEHGPVMLHTRREHLKVVLVCLLDNALRFSPPDREVAVTVTGDGTTCTFTIRDHGVGLPEGGVESLLAPFRQGDEQDARAYEGMGLGLYAADRIVRDLGGTVHLAAAPSGAGAVASVTLPVDDEVVELPSSRAATGSQATSTPR